MTTLLLLCLTLLDILPTPKPDNPLGKQFVVNDTLDNSAMTGCAMNPSSGGPSNHCIEVDFVNNQLAAGPQTELPLHFDNTLPLVAGTGERNNVERFIEAEGDRDETASFPPVAVVPEPPTLAILTISGIVLLYLLLFGRRKKERLYRRI